MTANVLQPLIDFAHAILRFFHDSAGFSWGASIIGLTVVVRLLILPLTFKQVRSMQALQVHMPEMKRIQERYKDDSQRKNQELMKFYQENKVNPLRSCLPILLQIPFFISIFYLLRDKEFKREITGEESFLFIPDLSEPATGAVLAALIVLYVGTQLGASLVTAISADKNQRRLMLALPFVFVFFILNFETGLIVYWITTNVWTVGQQLLVKKLLPPPKPEEAEAKRRSEEAPRPARGKRPPDERGDENGAAPARRGKAVASSAAEGGNGRPT